MDPTAQFLKLFCLRLFATGAIFYLQFIGCKNDIAFDSANILISDNLMIYLNGGLRSLLMFYCINNIIGLKIFKMKFF